MLFNSYIFILVFLPITLVLYYYLASRYTFFTARVWLVLASFFFYSWWNPVYSFIIITSIMINYYLGFHMKNLKYAKKILVFGITLNLLVLGYYKYYYFFFTVTKNLIGFEYSIQKIILPLAISFFTFQQIAYLVDNYRGETKEYSFTDYCLFVTFFPQLIAGPIVHHKEIIPQFSLSKTYRFSYKNISVGLSIFFLGLSKKVLLADWIVDYATPVFDTASKGGELFQFDSWVAAISYSLQLYFDFSGYSDMAVGLGRLFGIVIPRNFNSPYKAVNIIDFWRRWHITLSIFLRDYLYIALGGNRKGNLRRFVNLFLTMLLGGLLAWSRLEFLVWGGLHGIYLVINHLWNSQSGKFMTEKSKKYLKPFSIVFTFLCVVIAWVFFRADSLETAFKIISAMFGSGVSYTELGIRKQIQLILSVTVLLFVCWFLQNSTEIFSRYKNPTKDINARNPLQWKPNLGWAIGFSFLTMISLLCISTESEFLYFQF
ncbi:MAG: MBOAT family protein [Leptospiraceae bacterium]|nr:MBOAT family protein [Leptospiraceae bacterium]